METTFFENAFDGVPEPTGENLIPGERKIDYVVAWQESTGAEKEDYNEYILSLIAAGFVPYFMQQAPFHDSTYSIVFRKEERYLGVNFYKGMKKLNVSIWRTSKDYLEDGNILFENIPLMPVEKDRYPVRPADYGDNNFVRIIERTTEEDYRNYISLLEKEGFVIYASNVLGTYKKVYNTDLCHNGQILSVTHLGYLGKTYIATGKDNVLSEHLLKPEKPDVKPNQKTSLHMPEMWYFGNSFIVRLKNGHFLLSDGGTAYETPYLLDYLESLSEGETPIVEGWFFSHGHGDHFGILTPFAQNPDLASRIIVDGIYYSEPNFPVCALSGTTRSTIDFGKWSTENLRNEMGDPTPIYRPRMGERYYFSDITADIIMAQEQLPYADYSGDFNDSGTWVVLTIDGQRVLLGGDGDKGGQRVIMQSYDPDFMTFSVATLLHHGYNSRVEFTDFISVDTMLFTCIGEGPLLNPGRNEYLLTKVKEHFPWGQGTRILEFPYKVGESKVLPHNEWKYNIGQERMMQPNMLRKKW